MMRTKLSWVVMAVCLLVMTVVGRAQEVRLLGLTGLAGEEEQNNVLYEIDIETAETTELFQLTFIPDTHAIGFNPDDGLLYHTGGSDAWTDDPGRIGGFRDHQYLETVNLETGELTPIYNANPPPSPDDFPPFGLPAPLPTFIAPQQVRLLNDPACGGICERERGDNEFHGLRGLTWSKEEHLFYASDEYGFFKLDSEGEAFFIGQPSADSRDHKGVILHEEEGVTSLLAGTKGNANLWTIDPATGEHIGDAVELGVPPGSEFGGEFGGLVAMAQHPDSGLLFGVRKTDPIAGDPFNRELIIIFPGSGETVTIGNLGAHFASLAFVFPTTEEPWPGDVDGDGHTDVADLNIIGINWQMSGKTREQGDLTGDGNVNSADLNELALNWQTWRDGMPAAVPEPSSVALLLAGLLAACGYLRKHRR